MCFQWMEMVPQMVSLWVLSSWLLMAVGQVHFQMAHSPVEAEAIASRTDVGEQDQSSD